MTDVATPAAAPFPRTVGVRTLTVVLLLVALELVLRHAGGFGWWTVNEQSELYGWRMLPDQDARSRELTVPEHINHFGFRDREWDPPRRDAAGAWVKDESVYRVAVLGNSMSFGTSVPVEQIYPRVLEDQLQARLAAAGDKRRALVMNFAVQGYCLEQMARVYENIVRPWRPDLLIVALHPHDVIPMRPSIDDPPYDLRTWVMRTACYDLLVRHVIDRWIPPAPPPAEARAATREWTELDDSLTEQPFSQANRPWYDAAAKRMDEVRALVESDGGRLLLLPLPRWRQHFDAKVLGSDLLWKGYARARTSVLLANPWPEFESRMRPVAEEILAKGLPAATTHDLSAFTWKDEQGHEHPGTELQTAEQSLLQLNDMGHFTARGHAAVADVVARELEKAGLP